MEDRFEVAKFVAKSGLAHVTSRDYVGMVKTVIVPGSEAKQYNVILRRGLGYIAAECQLLTGGGAIPCEGGRETLCRHSIAAIIVAALDKGKVVSFAKDEKAANKLMNFGGMLVSAWSVYRPTKRFYFIVKGAAVPARSEKEIMTELGFS